MRPQRRLEHFLRSALPRVGLGVAALYVVFAALNVVLRPPEHFVAFVGGSLACAAAGLAIGVLSRHPTFHDRHAHPALLALFALVVLDQLHGYLILRDPISFGYMGLVLISAGVVLTSRPWFALALATSAAATVPMFVLVEPADVGGHLLLLVGALGISVLAFEARRANHLRLDEAVTAADARKRMLEAFLSRAPVGIYRCTTQGRVLLANPALERVTGYSLAEMERLDVLRGSDAVPHVHHGAAAHATEATWTRKDGSLVHVRESARLVREPDGSEYVEGVVEDVTAEREARDLARRQDRLAELGTLVAGVAHEVNNPLTYLKGNIEMSQQTLEDWAKGRTAPGAESMDEAIAMHKIALKGIDRIAHIVKALRLVAQPPRGERVLQLVDPVVESVLLVAQSRARDHVGIRAQLRSEALAEIDEKSVAQAVLNLLLNAVDAAADVPEGLVLIRTADEPEGILIEVSDNGRGIPPEVQPHLFTPFMTTKAQGTGLGLPITQQIVTAHGGALSYRTGPSGTSFSLRLPRKAAVVEVPPS